jgi:hypothetical protein
VREPSDSKSLTEKAKKAAKMAGFNRLFSPMSSYLYGASQIASLRLTLHLLYAIA